MARKRAEINPIRGERLRSLLEKHSMEQQELAIKIGYTKEHISYIINGKRNLTEDAAERIVEMFPETRIEWLLGYDNYETEFMKAACEAIKPVLERGRRRRAVENFFNSFDLSFSVNVADSSALDETTDEFLDHATADDIQEAFAEMESVIKSPKAYVIKKDGEIWGYCSEDEKRILFEEILDFAEFSLLKLCNKGG